jgi:hypothetical protein
VEAELLEGAEDGGDVAVGVAANDGEQFVGGAESDAALQEDAQAIDDVRGALGEVGDGAFFDLAVVAEGLAEEYGRGRVAIGDGVDVHGHSSGITMDDLVVTCQQDESDFRMQTPIIYMDTHCAAVEVKSFDKNNLQGRPSGTSV